MMKHDKDICPNRAENTFKSIIRSGFYPRKEDKTVKYDREKFCIKQGEFNPSNSSTAGNFFDDNYQISIQVSKKPIGKNHRSSIDFAHNNGNNENNYKRKNEFYSIDRVISKDEIQCQRKYNSNQNDFSINDNLYSSNKKFNQNSNPSQSKAGDSKRIIVKRISDDPAGRAMNTKMKNNSINMSNPILNPDSEMNIFS